MGSQYLPINFNVTCDNCSKEHKPNSFYDILLGKNRTHFCDEACEKEYNQYLKSESKSFDINSEKRCPMCRKPNQFGEVCYTCEREISEELNHF